MSDYYAIADGIDALDVMRGCMSSAAFIGFLRGNVIKYAVRMGRKGDMLPDAEKMADYARMLVDELKGDE